jgi:hypothetical protein
MNYDPNLNAAFGECLCGRPQAEHTKTARLSPVFVQSPQKEFQSDETEVCAAFIQRQIFYTPSRLLGKPRKYRSSYLDLL